MTTKATNSLTQKRLKSARIVPVLILMTGALVSLFMVTKATVSSFTHDESYTYLHYPHDSFIDIISFSNWFMNNHILNSLFMKYAELLFGNSELALRLPNLLALFVFMMYSYKLFQQKNPLLQISLFIILCTNVFLIDMFGLARGYGLSYGFMLMSFFHFIAYFTKPNQINLYGFHLGALLATLSHFTLLPFYIALLIIYNLVRLIQARLSTAEGFHLFKTNRQHFLPLLLNVVVLYEPVRRALQYGQLDVGGKEGFFEDTLSGFVWTVSNSAIGSDLVLVIFQIAATLIVLIPFAIIIRTIIIRNGVFFKESIGLVVSNLLLLFIAFMIVFNHYVLGSDYPVGRFLIFLIPLFFIHLGFFADFIMAGTYKTYALVFVMAIALAGSIGFSSNASLRSYTEWGYDSETKNMIQDLISYRTQMNDKSVNVRIGVDWIFEPTVNFYRNVNDLHWLLAADREGINEQHQYVYTFINLIDSHDTSKYEIIKKYESTNTVLMRKIKVPNQ